jgi:hypothetical protein
VTFVEHSFNVPRQSGQVLGEPGEQSTFFGIGCAVADQRAFAGIDTQLFRLRSHILHRLLSRLRQPTLFGDLSRLW